MMKTDNTFLAMAILVLLVAYIGLLAWLSSNREVRVQEAKERRIAVCDTIGGTLSIDGWSCWYVVDGKPAELELR